MAKTGSPLSCNSLANSRTCSRIMSYQQNHYKLHLTWNIQGLVNGPLLSWTHCIIHYSILGHYMYHLLPFWHMHSANHLTITVVALCERVRHPWCRISCLLFLPDFQQAVLCPQNLVDICNVISFYNRFPSLRVITFGYTETCVANVTGVFVTGVFACNFTLRMRQKMKTASNK